MASRRPMPFDYGSGRVNLNVAGDPGLTFDVTAADYVAHQNDLWTSTTPACTCR